MNSLLQGLVLALIGFGVIVISAASVADMSIYYNYNDRGKLHERKIYSIRINYIINRL